MLRIPFLLLLASAIPALGQTVALQAVERPVLKALPIGGDEDAAPPPAAPAASAPATPLETVTPPSPIDVKPTGDDAVRLQIFLDEANFGPGVIDGKPGRFTELAVYSWNEVNGHPIDDWTAVNTAARKAVPNPLAVAVVPESVKDWVDPEAALPSASGEEEAHELPQHRRVHGRALSLR
jgi:hypothetical protein